MKIVLNILIIVGCCSALAFGNEKKKVNVGSTVKIGAIKYSHGYGEFNFDDGTIERKRSHKRRKAVRKPRRGRGQ